MVNRETKHPKPSSTLKDINLLSLKINENILKFGKLHVKEINDIIMEDSTLL